MLASLSFLNWGSLRIVGLDIGIGVFHEFLLLNFVGDELMQGRELSATEMQT